MNGFTISLLIFLTMSQCSLNGQNRTKLSAKDRKKLNTTVDSLLKADQLYRQYFTFYETDPHKLDSLQKMSIQKQKEHFQKIRTGRYNRLEKEIDSIKSLQRNIDSLNAEKLSEIVNTYGFPGKRLIGSHKAEILLRHVPIKWEEKMHVILKEQLAKKNIRAITIANMRDRYLKLRGKEPLYYSELILDSNGRVQEQIPPLDRLAEVNKARIELGLKKIKIK